MRTSEVKRKTAETDIALTLNLDGSGASKIDSGCGFLDHMLTLFSKHGGFDLDLTCKGDTHVDMHHTCEDIGISLGTFFALVKCCLLQIHNISSSLVAPETAPLFQPRGFY